MAAFTVKLIDAIIPTMIDNENIVIIFLQTFHIFFLLISKSNKI